jgi:AcrR family transcriptional regulator
MSAQRTRQRILDAAQRLIETGGFIRLTTKEIARQAGCAEGTLFKHFKRKEDLCLAVVLENSPKFRETITQKRAGQGSVRANLEDIALAAIRFSDKLIPMAAALLADTKLLLRHRQVLQEGNAGPNDAFDLIAMYISDEQQLGRIHREVVPLAISALLLGPCFHWAFLRQTLGRNLLPMSDQEFATALVGSLNRGVSPEVTKPSP